MRTLWLGLLAVVWLGMTPMSVQAVIDVHEFETVEQERRFRALTLELRCPKCQNQSIADSDADIAMDMRERTAEMIRQGRTDAEIVAYFRERYGDFVSYRPPLDRRTLLLWAGPGLVLLLGLVVVGRALRRAIRAPLDDDPAPIEEERP